MNSTKRTARTLLATLLLVCLQPLQAAEGDAVSDINGSGGLMFAYGRNEWDAPPAESTGNNWSAVGELNVPLWRFIGGSVRGDVGHQSIDTDIPASIYGPGFSFSCSNNTWNAGASLYARDPAWGRIRAGYDGGRVDTCGSIEQSISLTLYSADVEAYLGRWTLAARAARETQGDDDYRYRQSHYTAAVSAYPTNEWRISVDYTHLPPGNDRRQYGGSIEYQPTWLDNRWGIRAGLQRQTSDYLTSDVWRLGVNYYFGPSVDLLTRDRRLR